MREDDENSAAWRAQISRRAEMMEAAANESANVALKALFLLNGGACVAVLGFLASTFNVETNSDHATLVTDFIKALKWFAFGSGAAVFASCLAYLANSGYAKGLIDIEDRISWRWGVVLNWAAIIIGLASFVLFSVGVLSIRHVYE